MSPYLGNSDSCKCEDGNRGKLHSAGSGGEVMIKIERLKTGMRSAAAG